MTQRGLQIKIRQINRRKHQPAPAMASLPPCVRFTRIFKRAVRSFCSRSASVQALSSESFNCALLMMLCARENEKGGRRCFDQTLQPIPTRLRDFAKLGGGIQDKIEHDQRKIPVAQKEIGGFDCVERFRATNPKQVAQARVAQRRLGIE